MAGYDKILAKIQAESDDAVEEIFRKAETEAERIHEEARIRADALVASAKEQAIAAAKQEAEQAKAMEEARSRQELLRIKRNLLSDCLKRVKAAADNLPPARYETFLETHISKVAGTGAELMLAPGDKKRLEKSGFLKKMKKSGITISDKTHKKGAGFLLRRGSLVYDGSFEALLEETKEQLEPNIAAILFGEGRP